MQQPIERDRGASSQEIKPGSMVVHEGNNDIELGSVERVVTDPRTHKLKELHVRHGRADYLLRVPARFVTVESPTRARLHADVRLEELERLAIESGRTPPTGSHISEVGRTTPSPSPEEIVGNTPGMPSTYDGPATG
jgi:hypothetical protein